MPPTIFTISMISHILNLNIGYKSFCCFCSHFTPFLNPSIKASEQTLCISGKQTPLLRFRGHVAQAWLRPLACFAALVIPFIISTTIVHKYVWLSEPSLRVEHSYHKCSVAINHKNYNLVGTWIYYIPQKWIDRRAA